MKQARRLSCGFLNKDMDYFDMDFLNAVGVFRHRGADFYIGEFCEFAAAFARQRDDRYSHLARGFRRFDNVFRISARAKRKQDVAFFADSLDVS